MNETRKELLKTTLKDLHKATQYLAASHKKCVKIAKKTKFTPTELEALEALTARFARLVDILFKRAYRAVLFFELEEAGTYLDMLKHTPAVLDLVEKINTYTEKLLTST